MVINTQFHNKTKKCTGGWSFFLYRGRSGVIAVGRVLQRFRTGSQLLGAVKIRNSHSIAMTNDNMFSKRYNNNSHVGQIDHDLDHVDPNLPL